MSVFTREKILSTLLESIGDALWLLAVLSKANGEVISKEKLQDLTNEIAKEWFPGNLINSRNTLDKLTSRLEGSGTVKVSEVGRARVYSISELGEELLKFRKEHN